MRLSELETKLRAGWSDRSARSWTPENPARGQCSVTALVVQDLLGGSILKTRVGSAWHYYNLLEGRRVDLTAQQFASAIEYQDVPSDREDAFTDTSVEQYQSLRKAISPI